MLVATAPVQAQTTGLPTYEAGDAFVFSDGRVEQVRKVDGPVLIWGGLKGDGYMRDANFTVPVLQWRLSQGEGRRAITGHPETLWPLAEGKTSRFTVVTETRKSSRSNWNRNLSMWSCRVGKQIPLSGRVGVFAVWPVRCDRFSASTMRLLERIEWDYAPEVGHYVRRSTTDYVGARHATIELSTALHGRAATPGRLQALSVQARKAAQR
jgi:hypothetical protein